MTFLKNVLIENDLEEGYRALTQREKRIIELYYLAGYRDEEIANFYGVTRQYIFKSRKKGIAKIKL